MKKLLLTAVIVIAPTLALAQEGSGRGECDGYRGPTADRPDCLGYNPFYNGAGGFQGPTGSINANEPVVTHRVARHRRR